MTPSDDRPDLPPEQDAVRRLLADARHDEPVPPAVAARLDAVLAELSADRRDHAAGTDAPGESSRAERPAEERSDRAPVVDLASRRRRGIGTALAAAAAVVVVGVGIGQVLGQGGVDMGAATSGGDSAGEAGGGSEAFKDGSGESRTESAPDEDLSTLDLGPEEGAASAAVPEVSTSSLRRDLRAALGTNSRTVPDPSAGTLPAPGPASGLACGPADTSRVGSGRQVPVTLDGRPALALYRAPDGARRQVDVYLCGTDVPAASVDLRRR